MNGRYSVWVAAIVVSSSALADGRIAGFVRDGATLGPAREARVSIDGPALLEPREFQTDEAGGYALTLPAGTYEVTYSASDFAPFRIRIVVRSNATIRANVDLCPSAVSCCLLVLSKAPSVDVGSALQQAEFSAFLPDQRRWGSNRPSRQLIVPRME